MERIEPDQPLLILNLLVNFLIQFEKEGREFFWIYFGNLIVGNLMAEFMMLFEYSPL